MKCCDTVRPTQDIGWPFPWRRRGRPQSLGNRDTKERGSAQDLGVALGRLTGIGMYTWCWWVSPVAVPGEARTCLKGCHLGLSSERHPGPRGRVMRGREVVATTQPQGSPASCSASCMALGTHARSEAKRARLGNSRPLGRGRCGTAPGMAEAFLLLLSLCCSGGRSCLPQQPREGGRTVQSAAFYT